MTDSQSVKKLKLRLNPRTILVGAALVGAFGVMASIFVPERTEAGGDRDRPDAYPSALYSAETLESMVPLGRLESNGYVIDVFATAYGPLYAVYDAAGNPLTGPMTPQQIAERFPALSLPEALADVPLAAVGTDIGGKN